MRSPLPDDSQERRRRGCQARSRRAWGEAAQWLVRNPGLLRLSFPAAMVGHDSTRGSRSRSIGDGGGAICYSHPPGFCAAVAWAFATCDRQLGDGHAASEIASYEAGHTRHNPSSSLTSFICDWRSCGPSSACAARDVGPPEAHEKEKAFAATLERLASGQDQATTRSHTGRQVDPRAR